MGEKLVGPVSYDPADHAVAFGGKEERFATLFPIGDRVRALVECTRPLPVCCVFEHCPPDFLFRRIDGSRKSKFVHNLPTTLTLVPARRADQATAGLSSRLQYRNLALTPLEVLRN